MQPHSTVLNMDVIKVFGNHIGVTLCQHSVILCSVGAETVNTDPLLPFSELM